MSNGDRAALAESGSSADSTLSGGAAGAAGPVCSDHSWLEIELLDENEQPIADAAYEIRLSDGNVLDGNLDESGRMRAEDVPPGPCEVRFPGLEPPPIGEAGSAAGDSSSEG